MDNEVLYANIEALEGKRPWPTGGRDDEPDALALQCSLLWLGARCACVDGLACQRLSLSQGDAAEHDRPSPWSCACRKLNPYVLVMQSTQDRTGEYATNGLDGARNRRVLVQGQVRAHVWLLIVIQIRPQQMTEIALAKGDSP